MIRTKTITSALLMLFLSACSAGGGGGNPGAVDCNDVIGGTAFVDECGECVAGNTGKEPCDKDCQGIVGGQAFVDPCGECVGGDTHRTACEKDCSGVYGGLAFMDECGECVAGETGKKPCVKDCDGEVGGSAFVDPCGNCVGGDTGNAPCPEDCDGIHGGLAFVDECGQCVGGNTGERPCNVDCIQDFGEGAYFDDCGICVGGNTGTDPCEQDCSGVFGGQAFVDECGECTGGNSRSEPCVEDCSGVLGGLAYLDSCNSCVGGDTDRSPCSSLALGEKHTCALNNGDLYCWGKQTTTSTQNQLAIDSSEPILLGSDKWKSISAASFDDSMYGVQQDKRLYYYWTVNSAIDPNPISTDSWKVATVGGPPQQWNFAIRQDNKLFSLAGSENEPIDSNAYRCVSAGFEHVCALSLGLGDLYCWGRNWDGQLGLGDRSLRSDPGLVGTGWKDLSSGAFHTCAIKADHTLHCWGSNSYGQTGSGEFSESKQLTPSPIVSEHEKWKMVSAGMYHTCGIQKDGKLLCWGSNYHGQLGDGTQDRRSSPVEVGDASWKWKSVQTGGFHTCGIRQDNKLFCWGWNANGQLGDGTFETRLLPTQITLRF